MPRKYGVVKVFRLLGTILPHHVAVVLLGLLSGSAFAKTPELSAIEVYPTGDAHGYVQISGFTLNAKNEVHLCTGVQIHQQK